MFSCTDATLSLKSSVAFAPMVRTISRFCVANPGISTVTMYGAGCSATTRYVPSVVVTIVCDVPFALLAMVTVTPGSAPPLSSVIVPDRLPPTTCAAAGNVSTMRASATSASCACDRNSRPPQRAVHQRHGILHAFEFRDTD